MYVEHYNKKNPASPNGWDDAQEEKREKKIDTFLLKEKDEEEEKLLPPEPEDFLISEHSADVLAHWKAPQYEVFERDKKWYVVITAILAAIIGWAIYSNSPVMAITFILIGIVGYIHINNEPEIMDFIITYDGVIAGNEMYEFDNIKSFWIFYEPEGKKAISLHTESHFLPYVQIPIQDEDPVHIREILLDFIPEEKHEPGLNDTMERILKI